MDRNIDDQYRSVLRQATDRLRTCLSDAPAGSGETPYLDALVLLGHAASLSTEELFGSLHDEVPQSILVRFQSLIEERCRGIPVSYLRGAKEFYGREFSVGPGVLVPRPDTEILVETALGEIDVRGSDSLHLHDCCTGSGCVAITIACERACTMTASDISTDALAYAIRNARLLGASQAAFWHGDLLEPLRARIKAGMAPPSIITANPPYVADNEVENLTARGWPEPSIALDGGTTGTMIVKRLAEEAASCLSDGGCLIVEIGADQGALASRLFEEAGFTEIDVIRDLGDRDRVCRGRWYRQ